MTPLYRQRCTIVVHAERTTVVYEDSFRCFKVSLRNSSIEAYFRLARGVRSRAITARVKQHFDRTDAKLEGLICLYYEIVDYDAWWMPFKQDEQALKQWKEFCCN